MFNNSNQRFVNESSAMLFYILHFLDRLGCTKSYRFMSFLFWLIVIPLIIWAVIAWLFRFMYKAFAKRNKGWIAIIIIVGATAFITWNIYRAFYPADEFYYQDFEKISFRKIPASADILSKSATYPDFHGDYCSAAVIELSVADYHKLLNDIKADKRFQKGEAGGSSALHDVMNGRKETDMTNGFLNGDEGYIGFFNDGRTVLVQFCSY
jgi:hypothetical protein